MILTLYIILVHFIAHFANQTEDMRDKKSTSYYWLFMHCLNYLVVTFLFMFLFIVFKWKMEIFHEIYIWIIINTVFHLIQEIIFNRLSNLIKNKQHWIYSGVGFDHFIYMTTLLLSYNYFVEKL